MPRELAALLCAGVIAYLFWRELSDPKAHKISWVPFAWMFVAGTRFVSRWLTAPTEFDAYVDGSPIDRTVFLSLIVLGSIVLIRRRIHWGRLLADNKWLTAYLLYCLFSIFWADEHYILFKRWIKDLGNPIMALIFLTESRPFDAVATTVRRLSFVFVPLSVLFIKYYPEFGRFYTTSGFATYTGAADQKNTLGLTCLLIALCYLWSLLHRRHLIEAIRHRQNILIIAIVAWLFNQANSQTALLCLLVGAGILVASTRASVARRPKRIMSIALACTVLYMVADATIGVREHVFAFVGRNETLTNRTAIWEIVSSQQTNPLIGVGFMSFWQGDRSEAVAEALGTEGLNQAHNGYLEQYVNLGYVGVAFIIVLVLVALVRIRRQLHTDYAVAVFRFAIVIVALLYNYTEASFYGVNNIWLLLLMASFHSPVATALAPAAISNTAPAAPRARLPRPIPAPAAAWRRRVAAGGSRVRVQR